ncbi:hypothetical protein [Aneurinibacillus thermoaerophilus]|uniref:AAA family ATPase n=1 Tax=Aneurinibacillus thermoaerophilus TaxID=143495 RepID=UPI002E1CE823
MAVAMDEPVGLVDLDIPYANIASLIRCNPEKTWKDWQGKESLLAQTTSVREQIYLLSCSADYTGEVERPSTAKVQNALEVLQSMLKNVIVDCGSSVDDYTKLACSVATEVLVVTTADQVALRNTLQFIHLIRPLLQRKAVIKLILNQVDKLAFKVTELEETAECEVVMVLPEAKQIKKAMLKGELMVEKYPKAKWSRIIKSYADKMRSNNFAQEEKSFFQRLFG